MRPCNLLNSHCNCSRSLIRKYWESYGTAQRRQRRVARVLQLSVATQTSRRNGDRDGWRVCYSCGRSHTIPPSDDARATVRGTDPLPNFGSTFTASWPVEKNLINLMKHL